ncbi:MAG: hypothetical protein NTW21_28565 [Verrucomicrobia bacterium]|nr:hypothetical protein [Verrucomicrobiota bacterium]
MSIWLFTGLAALTAGVLVALQYLRIRPRQVRVVTTLFWQQAADQARARTLFERFRHPRTYLLLLAASLLVLLALAQPVFNAAHQIHRVVVLEAGLDMTTPDQRFDKALELVRAEAAALGDDHVAVLVADPRPRLLKHFDESLATLKSRLAGVQAADRPVIREDLLRAAKLLLVGRENGEVVMVAAQPVTSSDPKVRVLAAGEAMDNAFILSAVFVPDSADLTRGAFHCRVGYTGKQTGKVAVKVTRAEQALLEQAAEFKPGEVREFAVPRIAADGKVLSALVTGDDAVAGDSRVDFQLPDRRRILVAPVNGFELPSVLVTVLDSLPEVTAATGDGAKLPVVRVGPVDSDAQILIQPAEAGGELVTVRPSDHSLLDGLVFEDALCRAPAMPLNVGKADLPLLRVGGSTVASLDAEANRLTIAGSLFDEDASLVRRTGYLVFWSKMLHHLAGWRNEPLTLSPVRANRTEDATATAMVLKASMDNFDLAAGGKAATPAASGSARLPVWQLLLVVALALMTLDALLNIRERIS